MGRKAVETTERLGGCFAQVVKPDRDHTRGREDPGDLRDLLECAQADGAVVTAAVLELSPTSWIPDEAVQLNLLAGQLRRSARDTFHRRQQRRSLVYKDLPALMDNLYYP